jgi:hypothetical protein
MHHTHYDEYRKAWDLYKGLLALNVLLFKLLFIWVRLCLVIH